FELISRWVKQPGRAVISVVHDLSLAKRYGHSAVLLNHGRMINQGPSSIALSPDSLQEVYGMDVYAWMHKLLKVWNLPQ
ncbi:MAG: ABC transporter ATP-binding protein, partial [Clostridiales bacterium]|nr:ABC transporter ATP-binding protein [Clostridiales bacterium]